MGNGAQGRNRTTDTAIFSRMLYQLSYLGAGTPKRRGRRFIGRWLGLVQRVSIGPKGLWTSAWRMGDWWLAATPWTIMLRLAGLALPAASVGRHWVVRLDAHQARRDAARGGLSGRPIADQAVRSLSPMAAIKPPAARS